MSNMFTKNEDLIGSLDCRH